MKQRNKNSAIVIAVIAVALCSVIVYDAFFSFIKLEGRSLAMGSVITYSINDHEEVAGPVKDAATKGVDQLDKLISRNIETSDISKINDNQTYTVSDDTINYIKECIKISKLSNGKFDITVGALSSLWNFDDEKKVVPNDEDIKNALSTVGYEKIQIDGNTVTVPKGTILDMGAIGKGLACGNVLNVMNSVDLRKGVVSVGGSVVTYGKSYVIGIRNPMGEPTETIAKIKMQNAVVSTSGNYEKFFIKDNVRYHHILDTQTGYPVKNNLASVTIVCENGLASDALSTACYALDFEDSKKLLDEYDAMAVFVYNDKTIKVYNEKYEFKITSNEYERK